MSCIRADPATRWLISTVPGLEGVAAAEAAELPGCSADPRPFGTAGLIIVEGAVLEDLLRLDTVHHVVEIRGEGRSEDLAGLESAMADADLDELRDATSFRATTVHAGDDDVSRLDVQRAAGAAIFRRYGTRVDLEDYAVNVRVDRFGDRVLTGIQHTRKSLHNRLRRARSLRSSLKPTVAAAMIRLVGAHRGQGRLIDPLCGTGTIPVEAKRINPALEVIASDWDEPTAETARATIDNHDLDIEVRVADARQLREAYAQRFDYIITDPPYGVRQARRTSLGKLYTDLIGAFEQSLTADGKIALVVLKYRTFLGALERSKLRVTLELPIETGDLHLRIALLEHDKGLSAFSSKEVPVD